MSFRTNVLVVAALASFGATIAVAGSKRADPRLQLRASPRFAFSPATVLITAELKGGDDSERYHCPEIEWDWDDGGKSVRETDCPPFEAGTTMERRFTATHRFATAGVYSVRMRMRRAEVPLAEAVVQVTVRSGLGDPSFD